MNSQTQISKVSLRKRLFSEITNKNQLLIDTHKVTRFKYSSYTSNIKIYNQSISNVRFHDQVSDFSLGLRRDYKENRDRDNKKVKSTEELILNEFKKHKFKAKPISKSLFSQRSNITYLFRQKKYNQVKENNSNSYCHKFKASPLPSLSVMEVRRSERPLTIAQSPRLRTKERSIRREEKCSQWSTLE